MITRKVFGAISFLQSFIFPVLCLVVRNFFFFFFFFLAGVFFCISFSFSFKKNICYFEQLTRSVPATTLSGKHQSLNKKHVVVFLF